MSSTKKSTKSISTNNQLTNYKKYDPKTSMIFGKAKPGTVGTASFFRIPIQTRYADGKSGDLLLSAPTLFSFGLQINTDIQTGSPNGWLFTLCLHSKDGATPEQLEFETTLRQIVDHCRNYLLIKEVSESVGKYDLDKAQLKDADFSFIKHKKDEKKRVLLDSPPVIYTKVIENKGDKKNSESSERKILTVFYNEKGVNIDPLSILNMRGNVRPVVKIESMFIGAKIINVAIKLWECEFTPISTFPIALQRPENIDSDSDEDSFEESNIPIPSTSSVIAKDLVNSDDDSESEEEVKSKPVTSAPAPVKKTIQSKKK